MKENGQKHKITAVQLTKETTKNNNNNNNNKHQPKSSAMWRQQANKASAKHFQTCQQQLTI
jgi:hypothetical protein